MYSIEKLYELLSNIDSDEFYTLEAEFLKVLYYDIAENDKPLCVTAFLTIANWFAVSLRSGVWTFYEATSPKDINLTVEFLKKTDNQELTDIFCFGIHDYQNPKYALNFDYPDEWIEESEKIDTWIVEHEDWLYNWERNLLLKNKELICSLLL